MEENKITVSWDELNSRKVDTRLREQRAIDRTRSYGQLDQSAAAQFAPVASGPRNLWYNAFFYMTLFGLLGGLLAWGGGELLRFKPTDKADANEHLQDLQRIAVAREEGKFNDEQAERAAQSVRNEDSDNPYFSVAIDPALTRDQWQKKWDQMDAQEGSREFVANLLAYGFCGVMIAVCLAIAEPLVQRNWAGAIVNGSVGAMLGLIGAIVVATWLNRSETDGSAGSAWSYGYDAITWALLGLFLAAAAGVVMRNWRKLGIGMLGGLAGGALGGLLLQPISGMTGSDAISRLVALVAIGVVTALATALVENAAKTGWLRVLTGLIAGKQFILYRNPTYVGSSPDCEIYLFKDKLVGPRHAAIHLVPGGFELENLPLGGQTTVNGKPITRSRLRQGDRIAIGGSTFLFQERNPTPVATGSAPAFNGKGAR